MARISDWEREAHEAKRREVWSLRGPNQIVKVLPAGGTPVSALGGYFTIGRFLLGKTPARIEIALGLRPGDLANGARIYRFARLPELSEYEYELTAAFPGGLAYVAAHSSPDYPAGSAKIPQWRIKPGARIPVDPKNFLDLNLGEVFPYGWLVTV